jgi:hypothetical protein
VSLNARQLTQVHRRQQLALRKIVRDDTARSWSLLEYNDLEGSFPNFAASVMASVSTRRTTSYGLAVAYLRAFRRVNGLTGNFPTPRPVLARAEFTDALRATSLASIKNATARGTDENTAMSNGLVLLGGAMARLVLNASRDTVLESVRADPDGRGFVRVLGGGGCDYCRDRAGIAVNDQSDVFESHGGCGCTAEPVYG